MSSRERRKLKTCSVLKAGERVEGDGDGDGDGEKRGVR